MHLRIFLWSYIITAISLVVAFLYGNWNALFLCIILGILEVSLSFDNAVINATILERMSEFWQKIFLTIGIIIAVFGMRLLLPLVIVWLAAGLNPIDAFDLAMNPPADDAPYFPDGSPSYETLLTDAHPIIAGFGGMFLLMLFLSWVFEEREHHWLAWLERPLAKAGRLEYLSVVVASVILLLAAEVLAENPEEVLISGLLGMIVYLAVNGLGTLFETAGQHPEDDADGAEHPRDAVAAAAGLATDTDTHPDKRGHRQEVISHVADPEREPRRPGGPTKLAKATGKAGFFLFLYLEVLDASFSFDGVIGAFAITSDPIIIALGLGLIGAMFVRSLTVYLVRKGTLAEYVYLEHGAHWAIGALAVILMVSIGWHVNEIITGLLGVFFIGAAFLTSIRRNKRLRAEGKEPATVGA
ncbi:DUF475 domain-containing protein [Nakamurella leprariae]|uniref:DUF475 domain-containing protein n=1 Tax=Nakamurella leprariae TaxID=2803911 RepID=A0A939BZQ2_9ACTN|nr:DUF475 domain-containing protein [Nakamurella leprariae]MBM9467936.1 DUF475 domain-containing protein [Nakamurella leprariae]